MISDYDLEEYRKYRAAQDILELQKLPWWRRWGMKIPVIGRLFRKRVKFKTVTAPLFRMDPTQSGDLLKYRMPLHRILEDNSVKDIEE
jgi:hypothetical protein